MKLEQKIASVENELSLSKKSEKGLQEFQTQKFMQLENILSQTLEESALKVN